MAQEGRRREGKKAQVNDERRVVGGVVGPPALEERGGGVQVCRQQGPEVAGPYLAALTGDAAVVIPGRLVPTHDTLLVFVQVTRDIPWGGREQGPGMAGAPPLASCTLPASQFCLPDSRGEALEMVQRPPCAAPSLGAPRTPVLPAFLFLQSLVRGGRRSRSQCQPPTKQPFGG